MRLGQLRALGIVLFVVGLWIFMAPFIGPVLGLYLAPPPAPAMGMSHMAGAMGSPVVTVNRAMVFFDFLPGGLLMLSGLYYAFRTPSRETA